MQIKQVTYTAFFVAAGIIVPQLVHIIGGPALGVMFLPMHIPVLIGAILLGPFCGVLIGSLSVFIGFLIGMPPMPIAFFMFFELATYGYIAGYLGYKKRMNIYLVLFISMLTGRLVSFVFMATAINMFAMDLPVSFGTVAFYVTGLPGIVIQIVLIPFLVIQLRRYMKDERPI